MPSLSITYSLESRLNRISEQLHTPVPVILLMAVESFCNEYEPRVTPSVDVTAGVQEDPGVVLPDPSSET